MIQILHNIGLPPPMIVFCNQKKTADMVCKDIQRAGVSSSDPDSDELLPWSD